MAQPGFLLDLIKVIIKEAFKYKTLFVVIFVSITFAVVGVGLVMPKNFTSSAMIEIDNRNIIQPLLAGQANTTGISERTHSVTNVIHSTSLLHKIVENLDLVDDIDDAYKVESKVMSLKSQIRVMGMGNGYIQVSYTHTDPEQAFKVVDLATRLFLENSNELKKQESRGAFMFIDKQVNIYKEQLQTAEDKLKEFKSQNLDGTEASVNGRISGLRSDIERLELSIGSNKAGLLELNKMLENETQYVDQRFQSNVYLERMTELQTRLDQALLSFTDSHPDVISLRMQIDDLETAINESRTFKRESASSNQSGGNINPLYESLRSNISNQKVEIQMQEQELGQLKTLQAKEIARLERIAEQQAVLAELMRDYNVQRNIDEDMLTRKERARLSMTLDVEGQGVNYLISEPANLPLLPNGVRFMHFALLGPVLGFVVPFGLIFLLINIDPRIRFKHNFESNLDIPFLGEVDHINTPLSKRMMKLDMIFLSAFLLISILAYISVMYAKWNGLI